MDLQSRYDILKYVSTQVLQSSSHLESHVELLLEELEHLHLSDEENLGFLNVAETVQLVVQRFKDYRPKFTAFGLDISPTFIKTFVGYFATLVVTMIASYIRHLLDGTDK